MITILSRILPFEISYFIYKINKSNTINDIVLPKIYILELTLDNLLHIYKNKNNSIIGVNFTGFRLVLTNIQIIKKYNYKIDIELEEKISKIKDLIYKFSLINSNTNEKIFTEHLLKFL